MSLSEGLFALVPILHVLCDVRNCGEDKTAVILPKTLQVAVQFSGGTTKVVSLVRALSVVCPYGDEASTRCIHFAPPFADRRDKGLLIGF